MNTTHLRRWASSLRAEAVRAGEEVHRVVLQVREPIGELVNEEPITIQP